MLRAAESGSRLDLTAVVKLLAARGIIRLMVEGGPTLAMALIAADLVDEAILFHSPKVVGEDGLDALDGAALAVLTQRLKRVISESVGPDRQEIYVRG